MPKSANLTHTLDDFILGLDWSSIPTELDPRSLTVCTNFNLNRQRGLEKRRGLSKLAVSAGADAAVKSIFEYKAPNGTNYVLVALGTLIRRTTESGWNDVKTSLTSGKKFSFCVHRGDCFAVNGTDANVRIRNTAGGTLGVPVPTVVISPTDAATGGSFSGTYRYAYSYKRTTDNPLIGNYLISVADFVCAGTKSGVNLLVTASADDTVEDIVIYRTQDLTAGGVDGVYYRVTTVDNSTATYEDQVDDADLSSLAENDNTLPPKATFVVTHKDRVFYANCPDETDGRSLVMWSKNGEGDAVPSTNYQYFDRDDGEDISGMASAGDYLVVFKPSKISVLSGDFEELYSVSVGIGCIAPWAILTLQDKLIFLSDEGFKMFDGANIWDVSDKINTLGELGFYSFLRKESYSVAYDPEKGHFQFMVEDGDSNIYLMVGHFVAELVAPEDTPEYKISKYISWTMHEYAGHTVSTLGNWTDTNGTSKILLGDSDGYIYKINEGLTLDITTQITATMSTGWMDLGTPVTLSKTLRNLDVVYATSGTNSTSVAIDIDFTADVYTGTLPGLAVAYGGHAYVGSVYSALEVQNRILKVNGVGKLFRYHITSSSDQYLVIMGITSHFRAQGIR